MTTVRVSSKTENELNALVWLRASDVPVEMGPGDEHEFEIGSERGIAIVEKKNANQECPVEWR